MSKKIIQMPGSVLRRQTIITDQNGEVISQTESLVAKRNGSGFVISYTSKMCDFLKKCRAGSVVRVFVFLAHNQSYANDGETFGFRCSHKYLQETLGIDRSTLWDALKFLKENFYVHVGKVNGHTEFMVNPQYVTIGRDKQMRIREWNRRWAETWKEKENGLR